MDLHDGSDQPVIEVTESTLAARSWKTTMHNLLDSISMEPLFDLGQSPFNPGCSVIMFRHEGPRSIQQQTMLALVRWLMQIQLLVASGTPMLFLQCWQQFVCGSCTWPVMSLVRPACIMTIKSEHNQDAENPRIPRTLISASKTFEQHRIFHITCGFVC